MSFMACEEKGKAPLQDQEDRNQGDGDGTSGDGSE